MKKVLLGITLICLWVGMSSAATIDVSACTPAALIQAVTDAAIGDTVLFPACAVTNWNSTVNITKKIHLKGAGSSGAVVTHIKSPLDGGFNGPQIKFTGVTGFTVSKLRLQGKQTGNEQLADKGLSVINGVNFAIFDNELYNFGMAMEFAGNPQTMRGVIYNNNIHHNAKYLNGVLGYGMEIRGNLKNYPPIELGTLNNIFVEDNTFEANRHSIAAIGGARYVARYNTFINSRENSTPVDAHGPSNAAYETGTRQYEIYNNVITNAVNIFGAIGIRGGDGVIFNNVTTGFTQPMRLWMEDGGIAQGCNCPYPCPNQTDDLWMWNNSFAEVFHKDECDAVDLQEGREYHFATKPGYTLTTVVGMPNFPAGKAVVHPTNAQYPHPLREDPPVVPPNPPTIFHVAPLP